MNSKERILSAIDHVQPDRVPIDFGSTFITGIHCSVVAALREHYGLGEGPVKACEPYQMLGLIEDDLLDAMGIDAVGMRPRKTMFGFPNEGWREWRAPWGQVVLVSEHFHTVEREDGIYVFPEGDTSAAPSGHMPFTGYFFDTVIRQGELDEDHLVVEDNLQEFEPMDDEDFAYWRAEGERLRGTDRAVVVHLGGTSLGDIALVPGPFLKEPRGVRDVAQWYMTIASDPEFVEELYARQVEIALGNLERMHAAVGDAVDVVVVCGTDFGTQQSSFCSTATFARLWQPFYRRMNDWIHDNTSWRTFKHSCGAVEPFLPHFAESGFDVVNPVQCSAAGMDPALLKERHGSRLTFWGGGVNTQETLPFGSPAQVREEVLRRCEVFAPGGGFVFNSIHNVQARTPVENVVAMLDAVHEFNASAR